MNRCHGCGGVIGRDCFNPQECEQITRDMAASSLSMYDQSFVNGLRYELDSLKKIYNDLAESHAKQVIEIQQCKASELLARNDIVSLEKCNEELAHLNNNQYETIGNLYDQIESLKKENERLEASEIKWFERNAQLEKENEELKESLKEGGSYSADVTLKNLKLTNDNRDLKAKILHYAVTVLPSKDSEYEELKSELLKAKELITKCAIFMHDQIIDDAIIEFLNKK